MELWAELLLRDSNSVHGDVSPEERNQGGDSIALTRAKCPNRPAATIVFGEVSHMSHSESHMRHSES